jgi:uncharacterized protein
MPVPTCSKCPAACCRWEVEVDNAELDRIPEDLIDFDASMFPVMKRHPVTLYCVALDLRTFACTIYESRPQVCRDFPVGSADGCLAARAQMSPMQLRQAL